LLSPADDTAVFEVLAQTQQEIVAVVLSDLTSPCARKQQHQLKLAANIVSFGTQREIGLYRLFRRLPATICCHTVATARPARNNAAVR
jgi:hypothetical protein